MLIIEPLAITKKDAFRVVGMPKLVQRWLHHGWVQIVREGDAVGRLLSIFKVSSGRTNFIRRGSSLRRFLLKRERRAKIKISFCVSPARRYDIMPIEY